jgi:hypothetical protein
VVIVDPPRTRVALAAPLTPPCPSPSRPDLRVNQMARLIARVTLLTTVDPHRRVRRVVPAFSLIVLSAALARN